MLARARREWYFVQIVIIALLVFTSLPYLYGYLSSPPDKQFLGLMLDAPDHAQYLSWFRGFKSSLLVANKMTPEPNEPIFFNLLWWMLAQISRLTGLGYAPLYQVFRWVAGGAFLGVTYYFITLFLEDIRQRYTAFLLIAGSSGLGWVLILLKYSLTKGELLYPLDVYIAEGNSFLCILGYPHFVLAAAFIVGAFALLWHGHVQKQLRYAVGGGIVVLILGWQHAYDLLIIYGVLAAFAGLVWLRERRFPWPLFWSGFILGGISVWPALYSVYITKTNPIWKEVLAQFANAGVFTPTPFHLIILFGLPLVVAVLTWDGLVPLRKSNDGELFLKAWFLMGFVLNYVPTDFQIHMLNSWQVPMMLLVTRGLYRYVTPAAGEWLSNRWGKWSQERTSRWLTVGFILAVLPTNLYLWTWRFVDLRRHNYPYYLYKDEVAALDWLSANSDSEDIVLSSLTIGQYIPAFSGNTAFLAHWAQTLDFYDKGERVARFFDAEVDDAERLETIQSFGVDYVFYGPAEQALGEYDPVTSPLFNVVFSTPQVQVYRVVAEELP